MCNVSTAARILFVCLFVLSFLLLASCYLRILFVCLFVCFVPSSCLLYLRTYLASSADKKPFTYAILGLGSSLFTSIVCPRATTISPPGFCHCRYIQLFGQPPPHSNFERSEFDFSTYFYERKKNNTAVCQKTKKQKQKAGDLREDWMV